MQREEERFFYASSFAHLSDVQQRQVGAIVGAAVGDAAVRAVDGATEEAIKIALEPDVHEDEVAFLPASVAPTTIPMRGPLAHHSLAFLSMSALLETLASSKTLLDAEQFGAKLWPTTRTLLPKLAASETAETSLYDAAVAIPVAAVCPYAEEDRIEAYLDEVWRALHDYERVPDASKETVDAFAEGTLACATPVHGSQLLASAVTLTMTRFMMRNPDAIKNASFRCHAGMRPVFVSAPGCCAMDPAVSVPPYATQALRDAESVMRTVRNSRSFAEGVRAVVGHGGRASHRGMLVGALLGARFGVRAIPDEWLRATKTAEMTSRHALEIATWGWNPPGI